MAVIASATGAAITGGALAAGTVGAGLLGGAVIGAGAGALYSGLTGDGNILNSALTGGLIGAGVGGLGAAAAGSGATASAAAPSTLAAPTSNVLTAPLTSANPAALDALAASKGVFAEGSSMLPGAGLNAAPPVISPGAADLTSQISSANLSKDPIGALNASQGWTDSWNPSWDTVAKEKAADLTGKEMLGYGLAGTAALSLLGGMNQPKISSTTGTSPSYIRPYTYSQTRNPKFGQPGQPYFLQQSYTAGTPYKAAAGGLMAIGGPVETMSQENQNQFYPQAKQEHTNFATSTQMPTSAEVVSSDYDANTNPYTGQPVSRFAEGGQTQDPNQFINMFNQLQASNPATQQAVNPDVAAYQNLLNERSRAEYINGPQLAAFRAAPPVAAAPAVEKPENVEITPDIKGLYQYYLGRQPTAEEIPQWAGMINGPVTPDMANYFSQFTGGELAKTGYKPKGPNPFLGGDIGSNRLLPITQNVDPTGMIGTLNADLVNMGVPQSAGLGSVGLNKYQYDPVTKGYTKMSNGGQAGYNLGGYSDGGRLLKGPGDGMSDNIPATIGNRQPARLADGEFVVPADVVSHLGNGSTDAGAKKLYAMMDKVRQARTGTKKQGKQIKAEKYLKT